MCGILGYFSKSRKIELEFSNALNSMAHRGPDFSNYINYDFQDLKGHLGHVRLAIIGLERESNQPFEYEGLQIVFNGEIYNYKEIKELLNKDFVDNSFWKGSSDTEVLLTAIEFLGLNKTLELVRGMFAFSLWDKENREIILVRDRFGEKPLYWGFIQNKNNNSRNIAFSSELKAFKALNYFDNNYQLNYPAF